MKTSLKAIFLFAGIMAMMLTLASDSFAIGTTYNTLVTNRAVASGGNFTAVSNGVGTNVMRIVGGAWFASADIPDASAGEVRSNVSFLTNLGNDTINFRIALDYTNSTGPLGGSWPFVLMTNGVTYYIGTNIHAAGANLPIVSGANKRITFKVTIAAGAGTCWKEWRLVSTTPDTKVNITNYLGDNGTRYGGTPTTGWGAVVPNSLTWFGTGGAGLADNYFRITVTAPLIQITKTVYGIAIADASGVDNVAIPGATITFRIIVTNAAAGAATSLKIRDVVNTANLIYVGGSMTATNRTGVYTWVTNAAGLPNIQWSNSTGNYAGYSKTQFTFRAIIR